MDIGECKKAEDLLARHIGRHSKYYLQWLRKMMRLFKESKLKKTWFGDMDTIITLVIDTPEKKVLTLESTCSCADITKWLIVWDDDELKSDIHIRELYRRGDGRPLGTDRPTLKFHQQREFEMDYVEKHHMTKLGGVYGDIRDAGYIISYEIYHGKFGKKMNKFIKDRFHIAHFYEKWKHFTFYLKCTESEIDETLAGKREAKK